MPNSLGSLVVRLGLDTAEFSSGLTKSEYQAQQFARKMDSNFKALGRFIATLGIGAAIGKFVNDTVSAASALDDLSDATGSSVESLSKLANQARVSGRSFDELQANMLRLSAGMAGADDESSNVGRALAALGITARDPAEALQQIAVQLDKYADGVGKAAIARDLFGKGGPAFLATLKDIANLQDVGATVSARQAAEAEKLQQALRKFGVESSAVKTILLSELVPAMSDLLEQFRVGRDLAGGFWAGLRVFGTINPFKSVSDNLNDVGQKIREIEHDIERGAIGAGTAERFYGLSKLKQQRAFLQIQQRQEIMAQFAGQDFGDQVSRSIRKPTLDYSGKNLQPDDTARRILDARLKDLDRVVKEEEDLLRDRENFLQQYYQDDKLSIAEFYASRQTVADLALQKQRVALAEEENLIRSFRPQDDKERIANQEKLADVLGRIAKTERDASIASISLFFERERAAKAFRQTVEQTSIALQAIRGDTVGSGLRAFDLQHEQERNKRITGGVGTADLDALRQATETQLRLNKASTEYQQILDRLGIAQTRLDIVAQSGALSEIELLNKRAEIARTYIPLLTAQADAQEKIALSMEKGPARTQALLDVDKLRLGIEQLATASDALKNKFDGIFTDNLTTFFDDITNRTKSLSQAFREMGASISRTILHLINEDIAKQLYRALFGASGTSPGGFLAGLLGSLFGAGPNFGSYATGPGAPQLGGPGGNAEGTNYWRGGLSLVGERGPEIVNLPRGAQVIPNHELVARRNERAAKTVINQTINVMPGTTRESRDQAAAAMIRRQQQAGRNL